MGIFSWRKEAFKAVIKEVNAYEAYEVWANDERLTEYARDLVAQLSYTRIQGSDLDAARTRLGNVLLEKGLRLNEADLDLFAQLMLKMV